MGDVCSRIDSITQGYVGTNYSPGSSALVPVWQITTDTGTYLLDMLTGEGKPGGSGVCPGKRSVETR